MASLVRMLMSAMLICIIAVFMHSAITLLDPMLAVVSLALEEMDGLAMTLMNARMELTSVTHTQYVETPEALTNAAASLGFVEMVRCVEISTSAWMDHMAAVCMQLVRTLMAPIHVRAMPVSMVMVVYALTLMSAVKEIIYAKLVPPVLTILVLTAAPAGKATLEMDGIVKVINNRSFIDFLVTVALA